jgi:hypothetical protein
MYAAKIVIALLLILAVVVAYNPQARQQAVRDWEQVKPVMVSTLNSLYASIRNLIAGSNSSRDGVDDNKPMPGPGGNFERIVTMSNRVLF